MLRIGVISDTHGLLRPEAIDFLRGSDHIVHAGDVGRPEVLASLSAIAPITAVRIADGTHLRTQREIAQFASKARFLSHSQPDRTEAVGNLINSINIIKLHYNFLGKKQCVTIPATPAR